MTGEEAIADFKRRIKIGKWGAGPSAYTMSREFLKRHCEIMLKKFKDVPTSGVYREHRLELDLLEQTEWIPVSKRLPEDTYPVNITMVNHAPEPYYATIKDKPFTAMGSYCAGKWYWYSVTCQDYLGEYRYCDMHPMDEAIEVIAWMPSPAPFEPQEREQV